MFLIVVVLSLILIPILIRSILFHYFPKIRSATKNEQCYLSHKNRRELKPFSSNIASNRKGSVYLSVVIPAYNETKRISSMIDEAIQYLRSRKSKDREFTFEIIVVDDGSKDNTSQHVLELCGKYQDCDIKVLSLEKNRGKGGAVTQGIFFSSGELILFADADGSTKFSDFEQLESLAKKGCDVIFGSRAHLVNTDAVVKRSFLRNFLMNGFHLYLRLLGSGDIKDTQCGFKLFSREAASLIFPKMHVSGWIFDIEILHIARFFKLKVAEVPVTWVEMDGSKVSIIKDSIIMALDLLIIKLNYTLGFWKLDRTSAS